MLAKGKNINNIDSFIESKLNNTKSIGELVKIREENIFFAEDIKFQINDFINEEKDSIDNSELEEFRREIEQIDKKKRLLKEVLLEIH